MVSCVLILFRAVLSKRYFIQNALYIHALLNTCNNFNMSQPLPHLRKLSHEATEIIFDEDMLMSFLVPMAFREDQKAGV